MNSTKSIVVIALAGLMALLALASCDTKNIGLLDSPGPIVTDENPTITQQAGTTAADPRIDDVLDFSVGATDPQGQALTYAWEDSKGEAGEFTGDGNSVTWTTDTAGTYVITVVVTDEDGNTAESSFTVVVNEPDAIVHTVAGQDGYVGKQTCLGCHRSASINEGMFDMHRHNHKLNPATDEFIGNWWTGSHDFDGIMMQFNRDGAAYVANIAGVDYEIQRFLGWGVEEWKQRYVVQYGNSWYITPAQWNVIPEVWVNYHVSDWDAATGMPASTAASYDRRCTGCHTTGYNVEYFDDTGEWVSGVSEENVQCEACHGPGETHATGPSSANILNPNDIGDYVRQIEVCGSCHGRGSSTAELGGKNMGYPFHPDGSNFRPGETLADYYTQTTSEGSFWQDGVDGANYHAKSHHEQYNEFLFSEHYGAEITCWACHNVHEPDPVFDNTLCMGCHSASVPDLAEHTGHTGDMLCMDCHMPYTAKSAIAYDIRSHIFEIITPQTSLDMLGETPDKVIPNSCMNGGCHSDRDLMTEADLEAMVADFDSLFGEGEGIHTPAQAGYVGRGTCMACHSGDVDLAVFDTHRHNHKLNPATDEFIGDWWTGSHDFDGIMMNFNRDGDKFVANIAGVDYEIQRFLGWGVEEWKQRYVVQYGNSWYITPAQWNVIPEEWVNYHVSDWDAGTGMPASPAASYDRRCTGCHTTGYNVAFYEETGEWVSGVSEENVQCEACHGPGETHAGNMNPADIVNPNEIVDYVRSIEVCGSCHGRGSSTAELGGSTMGYPFHPDGRNYRPGEVLADFYTQTTSDSKFWQDGPGGTNYHAKSHHEQYNEFLLSEHYGAEIACWTCHNVHEPDPVFDNSLCAPCHPTEAGDLANHSNHAGAILCMDCHMPYTAKSAISYDIRSHIFEIISPQVSKDMLLATPDKVIPNSCMNGGCHDDLSLDVEADIQDKLDDFNAWWPGFGT